MERDLFDDCKKLALCGMLDKREDGMDALYVDSFGCDLQVRYGNYYAIGSEHVVVNFGGRKVCIHVYRGSGSDYFVDGYWKELIPRLLWYEYDSSIINSTWLELCRRESARNQELLVKHRDLYLPFVREYGETELLSGGRGVAYKLKCPVDNHTISMYACRMFPMEDLEYHEEISVSYDRDSVFDYFWNSNVVCSLYDNKGKYIPGEWEEILKQIIENI